MAAGTLGRVWQGESLGGLFWGWGVPVVLCLLFGISCGGGHSDARAGFNQGLEALQQDKGEEAAELFLKARGQARGDGELRFQAAFALGLAHGKTAAAQEDSAPEEARQAWLRAESWFADASRLRPDDQSARTNLEKVQRRLQLIADKLNSGQRTLEARLEKSIETQRSHRDTLRSLGAQVAESQNRELFKDSYLDLATQERVLVAEVGTIMDLAADERGLIEQKTEEQREPQERLRQSQLQAVEFYCDRARQQLDDSRRAMRNLAGEEAHERATVALATLKRAREQLLDPTQVLKAVAADQQGIFRHTMALRQSKALQQKESNAAVAPWLTGEHLANRQQEVRERTAELLARFESAGQSADAKEEASEAQKDVETEQMLAAVAAAVTPLKAADAAMTEVATALATSAWTPAVDGEQRALRNLALAIELFVGVRDLINITYGEQMAVAELLDPKRTDKKIAGPDRSQKITDGVERNTDRMRRLDGLLRAELAAAEKQAAEAAAGSGTQPGANAPSEDQIAQLRQRMEKAQEHRVAALAALEKLGAFSRGRRGGNPLALARESLQQIEELRRLYFSIVEHLKELHRSQSETRDATADAEGLEAAGKQQALGPAADAQQQHASLGKSLGEALAVQADAAAENPQAQQRGQAVAQAAEEMRSADIRMTNAAVALAEARDDAARMSVDTKPVLEEQDTALGHIEEAIRLLEPPQEQPQDNEKQDDKQPQDDEQKEQQMSPEQLKRQLEKIRERDQERQRKPSWQRREPVEKDW